MFTATQNGDQYEIRFSYDPLLVETVKGIQGRRWVPEGRYWTIPSANLGFLVTAVRGTVYENELKIYSNEHINENATFEIDNVIPDIDISGVPFYVEEGKEPYQHQWDFMKYTIDRWQKGKRSGFILSDEMGCITGDAVIECVVNGQARRLRLDRLYAIYESHPEGGYAAWSVTSDGIHLNVINKVVYSGVKDVYKLSTIGGRQLTLTSDHLVMVGVDKYKPVEKLKPGDKIVVQDSIYRFSTAEDVVDSIVYSQVEHTYDIQMMAPYHNFIANDIVVHNCGKTVESMNFALWLRRHEQFKHCLVICCVNSSKWNWAADIRKHTNGRFTPYILGSRLRRDKKTIRYDDSKAKLIDLENRTMFGKEDGDPLPYFLVMNIEALRYKVGKKFPITEQICKLIASGYINIVLIDEIHKNTSLSSTQGKQIEKLKKATGQKATFVPITGTPILGRPTDAYLPLKLVDGHTFSSFYTWSKYFCMYGGYSDREIVGYRNIPELKRMLQGNMIRRLKKDVLDLPDIIEYTEYVENTSYQEQLYKKVSGEIEVEKGTILQALNPLARFIRLRQVNGAPEIIDPMCQIDKEYIKKNAKVSRVLELLEEVHERGEKALVYSNWVEPLRTLYRFIAKRYKVCTYTGTMTEADREAAKHRFMTDPNYTVMIGTIGAMGTSHTLTAANNVIFLDEPWLPSEKHQAIERAHRIGTTMPVNVYTILTKNTVDDRVHDIVYTKDGVAQYLVDNKLDLKAHPELFDLLLQDSLR